MPFPGRQANPGDVTSIVPRPSSLLLGVDSRPFRLRSLRDLGAVSLVVSVVAPGATTSARQVVDLTTQVEGPWTAEFQDLPAGPLAVTCEAVDANCQVRFDTQATVELGLAGTTRADLMLQAVNQPRAATGCATSPNPSPPTEAPVPEPTTGTVLNVIDVGDFAWDLAVGPDGAAWVTGSRSGLVRAFDPQGVLLTELPVKRQELLTPLRH